MTDQENGFLKQIEDVSVIGAGVTGKEVARFFAQHGKHVLVSDSSDLDEKTSKEIRYLGVEVEDGGHTRRVLGSDLIVVSPGVPPDISILDRARKDGIKVIGEIELAYRVAKTDRIIAVTGTNGKTTTVRLIYEILDSQGRRAVPCGNIGNPFIAAVEGLSSQEVAVVEVSSYQLEAIDQFRPEVGILLNVSPDHLSRHGSMDEYKKVKFRLFENQRSTDWAVVNSNLLDEIPDDVKSTLIPFNGEKLDCFQLKPHNLENLAAAIRGVECITGEESRVENIEMDTIERGISEPHRLEQVGKLDEVLYINDSKATNPHATIAALKSYQAPIHLLLGGRAKSKGYHLLGEQLAASTVTRLYLFGEARDTLAGVLSDHGVNNFESFESMGQAFRRSVKNADAGSIVLLSPACSSFDAYDNFEERGRAFKELVTNLI